MSLSSSNLGFGISTEMDEDNTVAESRHSGQEGRIIQNHKELNEGPSEEPAPKRRRTVKLQGRRKRRRDIDGDLSGDNGQAGASSAAVGESAGAAAVGGEATGAQVLPAVGATAEKSTAVARMQWYKGTKGKRLYRLIYNAAYTVGVNDKTLEQFVEQLKSTERAAEFAEINTLMEHFKINTMEQAVAEFSEFFDCIQKQQQGTAAFLKEMEQNREEQLKNGSNKYLGMNITQLMEALKIEIEAGRARDQMINPDAQQQLGGSAPPTPSPAEAS
jgi:hypothetical protein